MGHPQEAPMYRPRVAVAVLVSLFAGAASDASDLIPAVAWKRPMGQPLENPGVEKPSITYPHIDDGYWQGAPVGGLGAGTFSRTYRGDFARWHLKAGVHKYESVPANQFAVFQQVEGEKAGAQALFTGKPSTLTSWKWEYPVGAGDYYALYPKSWFDHRADAAAPVRLLLEQYSPILPNNYKESSYPVAVYDWHAENTSKKKVTVSILFSWTNMLGWLRDFGPGFRGALDHGNTNRYQEDAGLAGIVFDRVRRGPVTEEWDGQMAIAAARIPGVTVSHVSTFLPGSDGAEVWTPFAADGRLPNTDRPIVSAGESLAGAIAVTFTLEPGEKKTVPMALAWDLPIVQFGNGTKWIRKYTDTFGTSGTNAWAIAKTALEQRESWSRAIDDWQAPIVQDESKPAFYRGMLFNELYALADLGTFWGRPLGAPAGTRDTFGYMECYDYPFYETLDVRFYGSVPLAMFWPEIDKNVMRQFADTVPQQLSDQHIWQWKTAEQKGAIALRTRKSKGAVPHDLGVPAEDPFVYFNQFSWQNTDRWKDLNSKFALLVWRDYVLSGKKDVAFLKYCWPAVKEALQYLQQFDTNGDGLPENEGFPDQTYDTWPVKGESAYVGGLYLAALRAAEEIARTLDDPAAAKEYRAHFTRAQKSYLKKIWNGRYLRYDVAGPHREYIQSDQLAGQWYANMTGLGDIIPKPMRRSALQTIFDFNVMKFEGGQMGAVNGMTPEGKTVDDNEQVHEVWTGTTLGLAAEMMHEGLADQAYKTAWGIYHVVWERYGYWFRTPESWDRDGTFRASMYMRPAAIWAMELAPKVEPTPARR
jgi:non-lysosomal glucosylceramidase